MRKRIFVTLLFLVFYWFGRSVFVPGINYSTIKYLVSLPQADAAESIIRNISIFSLGVMPFVSSHIIVMLLIAVVPPLRNIFRKNRQGMKNINQFIYGGTIFISAVQAYFIALWIERFEVVRGGNLEPEIYLVNNPGIVFRLSSIVSITAGVLLIIWMANQINKYGIGNGISLFFLLELIAKVYRPILQMASELSDSNLLNVKLGLLLFAAFAWIIIFMLKKEKKIAGLLLEKSHKEIRMLLPYSLGGILPIEFTGSILAFPAVIMAAHGNPINSAHAFISNLLMRGTWGSYIAWVVLIISFTYFITAIVFNSKDLLPKLKRLGLSTLGKDDEKPKIKYLDGIVTKIIFTWGVFLCGVAFLPVFLRILLHVDIPFTGYKLILLIGIILGIYSSLRNRDSLREVFRHSDLKEIIAAKTKLEGEGIDVTAIDCESYGRLLSLLVGPLAEKIILVNALDYDKSLILLNETPN